MPGIPFADLPDDARLWIFPVQDVLDPPEVGDLLATVDAFLESWAAHGAPLTGGRAWMEDRFLLVAVDERTVPPSGCSIDSLMRALKAVEERTGKGIVGHGPLYVRSDDGGVRRLSRKEFRTEVEAGRITPESRVFDTTLTRVGDVREGRLERRARDSWHGTAFFG